MGRLDARHLAYGLLLSCLLVGGGAALAGGAGGADDAPDVDGDLLRFERDELRGEADPDKALIYVLRPASIGMLVKSWFFIDDEVLGANKGSSYFFAHVEPGTRTLWSKMENVDALELELEAGETYYVVQHLRMGWTKARTKLKLVDAGKGEKTLANCGKRAMLTDAGRARGAELAAEFGAEREADLERDAVVAEKKADKERDR